MTRHIPIRLTRIENEDSNLAVFKNEQVSEGECKQVSGHEKNDKNNNT